MVKTLLSTTIPAHLIPDAIRLSIAHVPLKVFNGCEMKGALLCVQGGNVPAEGGRGRRRQQVAVTSLESVSVGGEGALAAARHREVT